MKINSLAILVCSVCAIVGTVGADTISLQQSDPAGQSSFVTNMVNTAYGWNDPVKGKGAAPRSDADYLVTALSIRTPYDTGVSAKAYVFGGRSLTLDKATMYVSSARAATTTIGDLIVNGACTFNNSGWSHDCSLLGKLTLQSAAALTLTPGGTGHDWFFYWDVVSSADAVIKCARTEAWRTNARTSGISFLGDCSQFLGTVIVTNKVSVSMSPTSDSFPGNVWIEANASLTIPADSPQAVYAMGDVVASNSTVTVSANRTLKARTLVSGGSITNNLVVLGDNAAFVAGDLHLDGTKVVFGTGASVTATNSLKIVSPVTLSLTVASDSLLISVPLAAGRLRVSDFKLSSSSYFLHVKTENGVQKLYACPRTFDAAHGYVTLTRSESSAPKNGNYTLAYSTSGIGTDGKGWSDEDAPHSGTNYYSSTVIRTQDKVFQGDSMTIGNNKNAQLRVVSDFTVNDLRMVGSSEWNTSGSSKQYSCLGTNLTVATSVASPLRLTGGLNGQSYLIYSDLHGMADARISCQTAGTTVPGDGRYTSVQLLGDNSDYCGSIWVDLQTTLVLGSSFPGSVILGSTNAAQTATLAVGVSATGSVSVNALSSTVLGSVDVPSGKTLHANAFSLSDNMTKSGAGTFAVAGTAAAGSGAALAVNAGGVKALSPDAFKNIALTFAAGTSLVVDYPAVADCLTIQKATDLTIADTLAIRVDSEDVARGTTATIPFLKVPDVMATEALANKLTLVRPWKGVKAKLVSTSADGWTTYAMDLRQTGLSIIFR